MVNENLNIVINQFLKVNFEDIENEKIVMEKLLKLILKYPTLMDEFIENDYVNFGDNYIQYLQMYKAVYVILPTLKPGEYDYIHGGPDEILKLKKEIDSKPNWLNPYDINNTGNISNKGLQYEDICNQILNNELVFKIIGNSIESNWLSIYSRMKYRKFKVLDNIYFDLTFNSYEEFLNEFSNI
jgi:hypothetical protein